MSMASEEKTSQGNVGLLYTISEGLQGWSHPGSPSSMHSGELCHQKDCEHTRGRETATGSNPGSPRVGHDAAIADGLQKEGKAHPRLAQLRNQIRAQVANMDLSQGNRMMELVEKVKRKELEDASSMDGSLVDEGHGMCHCQAIQSNGLSAEVDRRLQLELAALRGEVRASLDLMRKELTGELAAMREELKNSSKPHARKNPDLSPLEGPGDKKPDQWKSVFRKVNRKEEQGAKGPAKLEGQFKARSVPSLGSQPAPSRNQVLLRAMTTISAKNALAATMSQRSNSDPLEAPTGKSAQPQPSPKPPARASEVPASCKANGKWNKKMNTQTVVPHPHTGTALTAKAQ